MNFKDRYILYKVGEWSPIVCIALAGQCCIFEAHTPIPYVYMGHHFRTVSSLWLYTVLSYCVITIFIPSLSTSWHGLQWNPQIMDRLEAVVYRGCPLLWVSIIRGSTVLYIHWCLPLYMCYFLHLAILASVCWMMNAVATIMSI